MIKYLLLSILIASLTCGYSCEESDNEVQIDNEIVDDPFESILSSSPDNAILMKLLEETDSIIEQESLARRKGKKSKKVKPLELAIFDNIYDLRAEAFVRTFEMMKPDFNPKYKTLDDIVKILQESLEKPCINYMKQVMEQDANASVQCNTDMEYDNLLWCRAMRLCGLVKVAFELDMDIVRQTASIIAPRARNPFNNHPGLSEKLELIAYEFAQLVGATNIARLVRNLIGKLAKDDYRSLRLETSDDVTANALEKTYKQVYDRDGLLAGKYRYVVGPFLKLAIYDPCENFLEQIGDNVSACHTVEQSTLACSAAKTCQLIRQSYEEKRRNWVEAERKLRDETKALPGSKDPISAALARNQADNYDTLKFKLANYDREMNAYKYL